jgi:hypothetical protein
MAPEPCLLDRRIEGQQTQLAFFRNNRSQSILPRNAGVLLAEYGQYEFGQDSSPSSGITDLILLLQSQAAQGDSPKVVSEMVDAALADGRWAVYGASSAVLAFFPHEAESTIAQKLFDEKIRFLRSLRIPNIHGYLSTNDQVRWKKLYPGEL